MGITPWAPEVVSDATSLVELRILEGPNLYFPRAAIKLTLDLTPLVELSDGRVGVVTEVHSLKRLRPRVMLLLDADKRPLERYVAESKRLLGVLETHLAGRQWVMDDEYTIADISMLGWVRNLIGFYGARELVAFETLKHVPAWLERGLARPAVERGLNIPKRP